MKDPNNKEKLETCNLNYKIISSGSSGNAVIIEDMLFDCGVPFSRFGKELYKIKYLLITHAHSDHLNVKTFQQIKKKFPRIITIGNYEVSYKVAIDEIVGDVTTKEFKDRTIKSFLCPHDVACHGFAVIEKNKNIIYATDTSSLENAPKFKYDYLFIESNHDENKIKAIRNNSVKLYGYDAWKGAMRHLSTQKSKAFYYMNRKNIDSKWIELHKSKRFY